MIKKRIGVVIILLAILLSGLIISGSWKYNVLEEKEGYNLIESFDDLELIGILDTDDNPWGKNLCLINKEEADKAILFTPNTGIRIKSITGEEVGLSFDYSIYDKVSNISDGVGIIIKVFDNDGIIKESRIDVKNGKNIKNYSQTFNLEKDKEYSIQIMCDNGIADDDSGDWLILENVYLTSAEWDMEQFNPFPEYIKGVHYFGEEWPINFWNSEMNRIEEDFEQIKKDGFNTIVLVIPWREFQPNINPIQYNEYALDCLKHIVELAEEKELYIIVRVGYTWDYYNDENESSDIRFYDVLKDTKTRSAWIKYIEKIHNTLEEYSNFVGGFITWEDFWKNIYLMDYLGDIDERTAWAKDIGFQQFIENQYIKISDFNQKYSCNFNSYSEIYIPNKNELFAKEYYSFFDRFMMELLADSQQFFPNLSMEVRTDWDTYYDLDNNIYTYQHYNTYSCANADYTTVMYGIPQGFDNNGERVSYKEALKKTEYILNDTLQNNMNKPIFIDQFLFYDNTPGFERNAQIKKEEIGDYLENIGCILKKYTCGYAVWTYKDYASNLVYNSQFALGKAGWYGEKYSIIHNDNNNAVEISGGGKLRQIIPHSRNHFLKEKLSLEFDIIASEINSRLDIKMGNAESSVEMKVGHHIVELEYDGSYDLTLEASDTVILDNIKLYSHVQKGYLYPMDKSDSTYVGSLKIMNEKLEQNQ